MNFHVHTRAAAFAGIVLLAAVVVLGMVFMQAYQKVDPERVMGSAHFPAIGREPKVLGAADVSSISSWMTFDYVNHVFGLPAAYLKSALGIADARYPELVISDYGKEAQGESAATVTTQVQSAVRDYFLSAASH